MTAIAERVSTKLSRVGGKYLYRPRGVPGHIPGAVDADAAEAARRALEAVSASGPTLALVSGGHDSLTAMYIAYASRLVHLDGVVHINTGIGVPETRAFVRERVHELGLDYYEVGRPLPTERVLGAPDWPAHEYRLPSEEYVTLILQYGFPGPAAHKWMYLNLKEKPLQRFLADQYGDREVTLISGVRRHESDRRMESVDAAGVSTYLGCTTISPIVAFTGLDVRRYRRALDLAMNPVVEKLEMSGECICGSFSKRGELRMLRLFYPGVWRRLLCLGAKVQARAALDSGPDKQYGRWGHNRLKDREQAALDDSEQMLLCESCERQAECENSANEEDC